MLAGIEETVHAGKPFEVSEQKSAIERLLTGLIDYAGLYPPASLDMRSAVENYLKYKAGKHAHALGRFIVDVNRIDELCGAAGGDLKNLKLSLIIAPDSDMNRLSELRSQGVRIEAVEMKPASVHELGEIAKNIPPDVERYIELPINSIDDAALAAIGASGARLKLRMGGVVSDAFPSTQAVSRALAALARHRLAFKGTAGLHHPIRAFHRLTYAADSPTGLMHGFVNLVCAAALIHFGGDAATAQELLDEHDPHAWHLTRDEITWRLHRWSGDQLSETRKIFVSFGSCSFEEPIRDLEALGWL